MHQAIKDMLEKYQCQNPSEYKNALKEIMQEVALLGLSRQGFFNHAAFYGGTALRIAHRLGRFSEDMDFTLIHPNKDFNISTYLKGIEDECSAYGLKMTSEKKIKTIETSVDSAFLKANTLEHLIKIEGITNLKSSTNKNDLIKIKLEIDIDPPMPTGQTESLFLTLPIPFSYQILTLPSLFAGKLHALLCRKYKGDRVKGRDYYDFIWYVARNVPVDLDYLIGKLHQSGHLPTSKKLDMKDLKHLLKEKFERTDWDMAKKDMIPFLKNTDELNVWSTVFFNSLVDKIAIK